MSQPLTLRTEVGDEYLDLGELEARIRRGEVSPQTLLRFPALTGTRFVPVCELELYTAVHEPRRAHFARSFTLARFPWITSGLILANLTVYALAARQGTLDDTDAMVRFGGKVGPLIIDLGELWRLLTANFLHRNALHIGFNMLVLLIVGGALENIYRRLDYLWLLVLSGIATMAVSLGFSDSVSLGASGIVYGCLGGVVIFGLRYRSILPARYRRILAEAAIPAVISLFFIGVFSAGVDNWAHVGGLCAGIAMALILRPRLLIDRAPSRLSVTLRATPLLLLLAGLYAASPIAARYLPFFRIERDDAFGISIPLPREWRRGADRAGRLAYYNGLPGLGRASFAAEAVSAVGSTDGAAEAERFIKESLTPRALGATVLKVTPARPRPVTVGGRAALSVTAELEEQFGVTELVAFFVPRGELVYQLVFSYPAAYPAYRSVIEKMVAGVRFDEPARLRKTRSRALLFSNAPWALVELGRGLLQDGDADNATLALADAIRREPANLAARTTLALALLQQGSTDEACRQAEAAAVYAPGDASALEAVARCELARGNPQQALSRLAEAVRVAPGDKRLADALAKLRESVDAP